MSPTEAFQAITDPNISMEDELGLLRWAMEVHPDEFKSHLLQTVVFSKHQYRDRVSEVESIVRKKDDIIEKLTDLPLNPARICPDHPLAGSGRAHVRLPGGGTTLVSVNPEISNSDLWPGRPVMLSANKNCILELDDAYPHPGEVGSVEQVLHEKHQVVLAPHQGGERLTVSLVDELLENPPEPGNDVLYSRGWGMAFAALPKPEKGSHCSVLEEITDCSISFDDIGGHDEVKLALARELINQTFHRDLARDHDLRPARGMLLTGRPGNGKTMLAKGLVRLAQDVFRGSGQPVDLYRFPPGRHRSMWYGQTEARIHEVFDFIAERVRQGRRVFVILDEVDQLGARGNEVGNQIDSRVLPVFLERLDGFEEIDQATFIATSNRADDLLDRAFLRAGRLGDARFDITPPQDRQSARRVFQVHLKPSLPYRSNGRMLNGEQACEDFIESALAHIFGPENNVAKVVKRDSSRVDVPASALLSGALIANMVRLAKNESVVNAVEHGRKGITREGLLRAVDSELRSVALQLKVHSNAAETLGLQEHEIADVILSEGLDRFQAILPN